MGYSTEYTEDCFVPMKSCLRVQHQIVEENMAQKSASNRIPVVDFRALSIAHEDTPPASDPVVQELVKQLYSACSTMGFVYLTNHGISQDEIDNVLQTVNTFFSLEPEVKSKYKKHDVLQQCGWDEFQAQTTNVKRPADLKESFDMTYKGFGHFPFPDEKLMPKFKSTLQAFYGRLKQLSLRVLTALAIGLDVNPDMFIPTHEAHDGSLLRFNYYPKLANGIEIKPGQIRCGEHSDYGSITLLVQDDVGGLEVADKEGMFVPATPIPGTILVNIANMMQRWTSDRLKSVVHRVVIPEVQFKREKARQSIAFFVYPEDEAIISCLDGSDKYPPVKAGQYVLDLVGKSYKY